ncbi:hypothetical protein ULMA_00270 [Patiriisocius marinus]|uniref:Prenyltransferase n=1 Tax=Patiriisocius marinus TaxID=1397112 RepID=A0A5J4ILL9_9FLAO|nr:hypothetical protein [Patiriisocius marinus]GER57919.1 hypothetical protein ULMA_00270 [Patiriisocius marinus]
MRIIKNIVDFYIKSSIHVALAVTSFVKVWSLEFNSSLSIYFYGLVFFATISGYNFVKYAKAAGLHHRSLTNSLQAIQAFSFVSFCLFLYCLFHIDFKTIVGGVALSALTFFYAVPLFRKTSLRTLAGIKVVIVAIVWAGVTCVLPSLENGVPFDTDVWLTFTQRIVLVLALMIPFEIRDLKFDELALGTMPQQWGINKTKIFGIGLIVFTILLEGFKDVISAKHISALSITCVVLGFVILISKKKQSEYFAAFWVESIPIFYVAILLLFSHFLF